MRIFNYSEARQNFSAMLNSALKEDVIIRRRDGSRFKIIPIVDKSPGSPFDIDGVESDIERNEIIDFVRDGRSRGDDF